MSWTKTAVTIDEHGKTIVYRLDGTGYTVESRLRHVPHSNRSGTWDCTFFHVMLDGDEVAMKSTLADAKAEAERRANW